MDTASIITGILGVLGFITSVISIVYTRQQTKNANEQLKVLKEDAERKKSVANASRGILQAIDTVKSIPKRAFLNPLDFSRDNILTYLNANPKETTLTLVIKEQKLEIFSEKKILINKSYELADLLIKNSVHGGSLEFQVEPKILQNEFVEVADLLDDIEQYYSAYNILKQHEEIIRSCESRVIEDFRSILEQIIEVIVLSKSNERRLSFSSSDKWPTIMDTLNNGIVNMKLINVLQDNLCQLCDERLTPIQQKLFEMASQ